MEALLKVSKDFTIQDLASLVRTAEASTQCVELKKGTTKVDCKSILGVYSLGLKKGEYISVVSSDEDILADIKKELSGE